MSSLRNQLITMAVGAVIVAGIATAQGTEVPTGNLFYQNGAANAPNVSLVINNPQNMSGGNGVGGPNYWVGGNSPVLDGTISTVWNAGTFGLDYNGSKGEGMCNVAVSQGSYTPPPPGSPTNTVGTFTSVPFGAIGTIRIWAEEQPTPTGVWVNYPQQVKVAYATTNLGAGIIGNGFNYNSGTLGVTPPSWNINADITAVNGGAPSAPTDSVYTPAEGWVAGAFTQGVTVISSGGYGVTAAYMDLTVNIPAGATSVMISFGQDNAGTGNQGGLTIADLQAFGPVPEPGSLGLLAVGSLGLLLLKRHKSA